MTRPSFWSGFRHRGWHLLSPWVRGYAQDVFGKDRLIALETIGMRYGLFDHQFFTVFQTDPPKDPSLTNVHVPFTLCNMLTAFATALSESNHHDEAVAVLDAATCIPTCGWDTFGQLAIALHWAGRRHAAVWTATQAKLLYDKRQRDTPSFVCGTAEGTNLLKRVERLCEGKDPYGDSHRLGALEPSSEHYVSSSGRLGVKSR